MNENYFMNYDITTGEIKGFYLKSIHGSNIPTPNIEITQEKHQFYMENNGKYKINVTTLEDELIPFTQVVSQPNAQDILNAQLLKANAEITTQLDNQKTLNAQLLLDIAKLKGGN